MNKQLSARIVSQEEQRIKDWVQRQRQLYPYISIPKALPKPKQRGHLGSTAGGGMVEFIQEIVAEDYGISRHEIISNNRSPIVTLPRQVAMYLADKITGQSLLTLGQRFGNKNHTTVLHAKNKIAWYIGERDNISPSFRKKENLPEETDLKLAKRVARLEEKIKEEWAQKLASQI